MSDEKHHIEPYEDRTVDPGQRVSEAATRLGRLLGRTAHRATEVSEQAARDARPEAERLARTARAAVDAARPRIERAGRSAIQYVREHDAEIKRAARISAEVTAHQVMPLKLRPIVAALESDRWKRAPLRDRRDPGIPSSESVTSSGPATPSGNTLAEDVPHQPD